MPFHGKPYQEIRLLLLLICLMCDLLNCVTTVTCLSVSDSGTSKYIFRKLSGGIRDIAV